MIRHRGISNLEICIVVSIVCIIASLVVGIKSSHDNRIEKENEEMLTIDLTVVLAFGVNIPEICVQLQAAVKEAVEGMTGQQVYAVNVVVQGVRNLDEKSAGEA